MWRGIRNTNLYRTWLNLKNRCSNSNHPRYKDYGGRGISVCDEWRYNFQAFYDWAMSHGYRENLTLDRINNDGNYEPSNCRWTTVMEQNNNTRRCHYIEYRGEKHSLSEWSRILNIPRATLSSRINVYNYPIEQAFTEPIGLRVGKSKG